MESLYKIINQFILPIGIDTSLITYTFFKLSS